jgi:hypothetical protein
MAVSFSPGFSPGLCCAMGRWNRFNRLPASSSTLDVGETVKTVKRNLMRDENLG